MIDKEIVFQHINELENIIKQLEHYKNISFTDFKSQLTTIWAVEHGLQLAIQNLIDIGGHILAAIGENNINNYTDILQKLGENEIIPKDFSDKITGMAGFRNILVHEYIKADIQYVYNVLTGNISDFTQFIAYIKKYLSY